VLIRLAFALLSTPISLPLPPLANFLDTLDGRLDSTGLTNCMKRGARRIRRSWFYCIALAIWLGWARRPWSYNLLWLGQHMSDFLFRSLKNSHDITYISYIQYV
jgi:hypothetical protein